MIEAQQSYQQYVARAIVCAALHDAKRAAKQKFRDEGRRLNKVSAREINLIAREMLDANPAELVAKAKASDVVQDELV